MHDLPYTTPLQFIGLALALLAGWLLGMASGVGSRHWRERQLNQLGIQHFRDIEELPRGTIIDEHWREQAALLRAGRTDEHARRFGQHA